MAAKRRKKKTKARPATPLVKWIATVLTGSGRPVGLALLVIALFAGTIFVLWNKYGSDVLASDQYRVSVEDLQITPLPGWIRNTDVRGQVFHYIGSLSIMDDNATQRVTDAFRLHPWVDRVISVSKHHPARIRVELKYRRPVCMVECMVQGEKGLRAVDVRGVWLPGNDFDPQQAARRYPRLVGVNSEPLGGLGFPWGDERVVGAAEIADAFGEAWGELKLDRIAAGSRVRWESQTEYTYELFTRSGTRILWGRSPRTQAKLEVPAEEKIARLRQYAMTHGSLDGVGGSQNIDVRHPDALRLLRRVAAAQKTDNRQQRQ